MTLQEQAASEEVWRAEEEAVKELSNKIIQAAVADEASDIHIDPAPKETKVRFRIDGVMHDVLALPRKVHDPLLTRFKTMADLDTANRRSLQNGRILVSLQGREYDLRETVLPSFWGEKATMRILEAERGLLRLDQVGYRDEDRKRLDQCLRAPWGLLIFSGPTGCGKTTLMYGALQEIIHPEVVVLTVEDPVEYRLPDAIQVNVNRKAGLTEPEVLRGFLRSDPDIIMVGNIPDLATAELAIQAALTGHLVLAPLHALDAPRAIQRLLDMGIEPFLLSEGLLLVQSQRLIRMICKKCKEAAKHPAGFLEELRKRAEAGGLVWPDKPPVFHKGKGCEECRGTGYWGRIGIFEVMVPDGELRSMFAERADTDALRKAAVKKGMTTMLADGIYKALAGQTTIEEVLRVSGE